jgi:hypothetical protein
MPSQLFSSPIGLSQLDPQVKERLALPLASNSGGSAGDDGLIHFATGNEVYTFDSNSIKGNRKPRAITSAWIDATNLAAGKILTVSCSNGQKFILQNTTAAAGQGTQGYFIIPLPAPFKITVTTNNGASLDVTIILYNYNVAFTGFETRPQLISPPSSAAGGSSGGGGSFSGGSGGGGFPEGCPISGTTLSLVNTDSFFDNTTFENEEWITIECVGKIELTATPSHRIFTIERGKVALRDVIAGEHVLTIFGEREIASITYFKKKDTAIKVHVPNNHLFYANGILSHNVKQ